MPASPGSVIEHFRYAQDRHYLFRPHLDVGTLPSEAELNAVPISVSSIPGGGARVVLRAWRRSWVYEPWPPTDSLEEIALALTLNANDEITDISISTSGIPTGTTPEDAIKTTSMEYFDDLGIDYPSGEMWPYYSAELQAFLDAKMAEVAPGGTDFGICRLLDK